MTILYEALKKAGCGLYYYKKDDSTLKEDFFMRTADNLVPVEVKATNNMARSLNTLINSDKYPDIKFGIKVVGGNIGCNNNVYTFPYFCTFLLKEYLRRGPPKLAKSAYLCYYKYRKGAADRRLPSKGLTKK